MQSIDDVGEVLEPLKVAASIDVEALMNEARWEMEREQRQVVVDTIGREGTRQYRACV